MLLYVVIGFGCANLLAIWLGVTYLGERFDRVDAAIADASSRVGEVSSRVAQIGCRRGPYDDY